MTDSDQPEQNIEDLIGPSRESANPIDQVRSSLGEEEWKALLEGPLNPPDEFGPVLLFLTPEAEEAAELLEWLRGRATVLPLNRAQKPTVTPMSDFCAVIIRDSILPIAGGLEQFTEGIPVAILQDGGEPGCDGNLWRLPRPIVQLQNSDVIDSLLLGQHPPGGSKPPPEHSPPPEQSPPPSDHGRQQGNGARDDLPDTISAIRELLEARKKGDSTIEALRRWVVDDPAFLGWVELKNATEGIEVKVGGKEPGKVLRSVGDEIDIGEPIPTTVGSLGPFVGLPISDVWLGFLARNAAEGRKEFWKMFALVPLIEQLIPSVSGDGTPLVEDPEDRFCRLLETRLNSAQRRGGAPGVLVLESPGGSQDLVATVSGLLRGSDWMEVAGERLWVLLDHPDQGAIESLTQRLGEALPGLRGGGTINVSSGVQARECMERVVQLLRNSDHLHIEEHGR